MHRFLQILTLFAVTPLCGFAQVGSISAACASTSEANHWTVDILLSKNAARANVANLANYRALDLDTSTDVTLLESRPGLNPTPVLPGAVSLALDPTVAIDGNRHLLLIVRKSVFESDGHRLWPLRDEATLDTDKSGATIAVIQNTKPKDYVKSSATVSFGDFWGLTLAHEYGQLAPLHKLVDNKMTIGLTFKAILRKQNCSPLKSLETRRISEPLATAKDCSHNRRLGCLALSAVGRC